MLNSVYCRQCKAEIDPANPFCPKCGTDQRVPTQQPTQQMPVQPPMVSPIYTPSTASGSGTGTIGLAIVGVVITVIGFGGIIWLQNLRADPDVHSDSISLIIGYAISGVLLFIGWLPLFSHLRKKN